MPIMPFGERFICRTPMWRSFARSIVGWSLSGETLSGAVLEVGGGSGAMAKGMLSRFPDVQLTVADLDPLMVESVNRQLASFGDRAKAVVGDATDLPFEDNSFEVVVSNLMLHHIGNWEAAVHEAIRVVRPGGRFVGYDVRDTAVSRGFHHLDQIHDLRSIMEPTFAAELRAAGITDYTLRKGRFGLTLRWVAHKPW